MAGRLKPLDVERQNKPGKYADGEGIYIVQERRNAREEAKAVETEAVLSTFEECEEAYIRANWSSWSEKHRDQWHLPSSVTPIPSSAS